MSQPNPQLAINSKSPGVWSNKNYVLLLVTSLLVTFGGKVYELSIPLIVYELTQSSVSMGLMSAIEFLPNLLLAFFIGAIIDKVQDKKAFMIGMILLQSLLLLSLYLFMNSGYFSITYLYLYAFALMTLNYGYYNIRFTIVKYILPESLFARSTANFTFITQCVTVLGPSIAGVILLLSDLKIGLLITGAALLLTTVISFFLDSTKESNPTAPMKEHSLFQDIKEAWSQFKKLKGLWTFTWFVVFTNASYGMFNAMLVYYAKTSLNLNSSMVGLLLSSLGLGGVLGSLLFSFMRKHLGIGKTAGVCILLTGFGYGSLTLMHNVAASCLSLFLIGLFATAFSICVHAYRQEITPSEYIGRIVGITGSLFKLAMPLFIFGSGWITDWFSVNTVYAAAGILNLLLFVFYFPSHLWKLR